MIVGESALGTIEAVSLVRESAGYDAQPALDTLAIGVPALVGAPLALNPTVLRLLEMGLTPGTEIVVTRRAPSSDPIEIRLRGTRVCLRRSDAARFPVRVVATAVSRKSP